MSHDPSLTPDERSVLDVFCREGATLPINTLASAPFSGDALLPILKSLVDKGYILATPGTRATFHLTDKGVQHCGGPDHIPRR